MKTRAEVINAIARASIRGNLGYFVGTGFSMALTAGTQRPAPNWTDLLGEVQDRLNANLAEMKVKSEVALPSPEKAFVKSAAALATGLCNEYAQRLQETEKYAGREPDDVLREASLGFKVEVARLCAFSPNPQYRDSVARFLREAPPSWVVTTNYDVLLEEVLANSISLQPQEPILTGPESVPVYHLHGHHRAPASIVILEEDYHAILLTQDYRQAKLTVAFSESLTVLLGYSLGDTNVQLALKSARSFELDNVRSSGGVAIQAYYTPEGDGEPREEGGLVLLPISDVAAFLGEVAQERARAEVGEVELERSWSEFYRQGKVSFVSNAGYRQKVIPLIIRRSRMKADRTVAFLDESLTPVLAKAQEHGGFSEYGVITDVLLDLLASGEFEHAHPALFAWTYRWLAIVSTMISEGSKQRVLGDSWAATRAWHDGKPRIGDEVMTQIRERAEREHQLSVLRLLK